MTKERWKLVAGSLCAVVVIVAAVSPNEMVDADSALTLVTAQILLERGSSDLGPYASDPGFRFDLESDYRVRKRDGGYYYYNRGTPVSMAPLVWATRVFGLDMRRADDDETTQNVVSAVLCGATFGLLFVLIRRFVPEGPALVITTISFCGSSLMSTGATALWSQTIVAPLMVITLLVTLRCDPDCGGRLSLPRLAPIPPLLAAAFLCRPTTAFLALGLVTWLALRMLAASGDPPDTDETTSSPIRRAGKWLDACRAHRLRTAVWALAAIVGSAVLAAVVWNSVPGYYHPARLLPRISPTFGVYAVLLSPSRGLLIYCPFLIVVAAGLVGARRSLECRPLLALAAVWSVSHLAALSVRTVWYGGHSFGPRMAAEVVLAAAIPTALAWKALRQSPRRSQTRFFGIAYLVLGAFAVVLHSGQGLFNPAVQRWNYTPDVDTHPHLLMSWRYPQTLATSEQIKDRAEFLQLARLEVYAWGDHIRVGSANAVFHDWHRPEGDRIWSRNRRSDLSIRLPSNDGAERYLLQIHGSGLGSQRVQVRINESDVGERLIAHPPSTHTLRIPAAVLSFNSLNTIELHTPGAHRPPNGDPRTVGLCLHWVRIVPEPSQPRDDEEISGDQHPQAVEDPELS